MDKILALVCQNLAYLIMETEPTPNKFRRCGKSGGKFGSERQDDPSGSRDSRERER